MKKGIKYLAVLCSVVFLLAILVPTRSLSSQEQADEIELISVSPPAGTILQRGTEVPFEVKVSYKLESQPKGFIDVCLALLNGKCVFIKHEVDVSQGSGTVVISGLVNVEDLYDWVETDIVYLELGISYWYSDSKDEAGSLDYKCLTEYPYYIKGEAPPEEQPPVNDVDEEQSVSHVTDALSFFGWLDFPDLGDKVLDFFTLRWMDKEPTLTYDSNIVVDESKTYDLISGSGHLIEDNTVKITIYNNAPVHLEVYPVDYPAKSFELKKTGIYTYEEYTIIAPNSCGEWTTDLVIDESVTFNAYFSDLALAAFVGDLIPYGRLLRGVTEGALFARNGREMKWADVKSLLIFPTFAEAAKTVKDMKDMPDALSETASIVFTRVESDEPSVSEKEEEEQKLTEEYLMEDGIFVLQLEDLLKCSQDHLSHWLLLTPASAVFPNIEDPKVNIKKLDDNVYLVEAYVDSQNVSRAMVRSYYSNKITFTPPVKSTDIVGKVALETCSYDFEFSDYSILRDEYAR